VTTPTKDWRYAAGTVINIYVMNRAADGAVTWTKTAGRTLAGAIELATAGLTFGAITMALF